MGSIFRQIVDWVFPFTCELCGNGPLAHSYLCDSCQSGLKVPEKPLCFRCGEPMEGAVSEHDQCPHCRGHRHYFDFARAACLNEGDGKELVHRFKYVRKIYLGKTLAELMLRMWTDYDDVLGKRSWVLVPVPIHHSKLRERGFNQARELAGYLAKFTGFPLREVLKRKDDRVSQALLDRDERWKHVRGLYSVKQNVLAKGMLRDKNVLLIDDVLTTGSTAEVCAKELKKAGAGQVGVLTVLRSCMKISR